MEYGSDYRNEYDWSFLTPQGYPVIFHSTKVLHLCYIKDTSTSQHTYIRSTYCTIKYCIFVNQGSLMKQTILCTSI